MAAVNRTETLRGRTLYRLALKWHAAPKMGGAERRRRRAMGELMAGPVPAEYREPGKYLGQMSVMMAGWAAEDDEARRAARLRDRSAAPVNPRPEPGR
jgi:hypothetical protein